eukprot:1719148-Pyramimonas_sp.AAC.1
MYPGVPTIYVFDEAPGRVRAMPAPGLFAPVVAAGSLTLPRSCPAPPATRPAPLLLVQVAPQHLVRAALQAEPAGRLGRGGP